MPPPKGGRGLGLRPGGSLGLVSDTSPVIWTVSDRFIAAASLPGLWAYQRPKMEFRILVATRELRRVGTGHSLKNKGRCTAHSGRPKGTGAQVASGCIHSASCSAASSPVVAAAAALAEFSPPSDDSFLSVLDPNGPSWALLVPFTSIATLMGKFPLDADGTASAAS